MKWLFIFLFSLTSIASESSQTDELRISTSDVCRAYFTDPFRKTDFKNSTLKNFLAYAFNLSDRESIQPVKRIIDLGSNLERMSSPHFLINTYLDFLDVNGSAIFYEPKINIINLKNEPISFFDWLASQSDEFRVDRLVGGKIQLTKLKDGNKRVRYLNKNWRGRIFEQLFSPPPRRERFRVFEGELDEKKTNHSKSVYYLGEGINGVVKRIIPKDKPWESYIEKTYSGETSWLDLFFENRSLNVLNKIQTHRPVHGLSIVKIKNTSLNTMHLEDIRGMSLHELKNQNLLSEWEIKYLENRIQDFEISINSYMKSKHPFTDFEKIQLRESISLIRQSKPDLSNDELLKTARERYLSGWKKDPAVIRREIEIPISLNPLSPGFLLPLNIKLSDDQFIVDPITLHITIIDAM